jgi:hypothetical protein
VSLSVPFASRVARLPQGWRRLPLGVTCPHCGYKGTADIEGEGPQFFPGFRAQELLYVYHLVVGAALHRSGTIELLADIDTFEINEMEPPQETNLECGNCDQTFPAPYALRFV